MPTSRADDEEIEDVYAGIEKLLKLTKGKDKVFIMGDWNAVVGNRKDGRELGKYGLGQISARGDQLVEFSRENSFVITNTLFKKNKRRRYTWKMPGIIRRYQIDYILVKNRFKNRIKSCNPGADCDNNHQLMGMKFCVKLKKIVKGTIYMKQE